MLSVLFPALAQERHNSLAIDERLNDEAGPYYFISYGDSTNAYARAVPLAAAMGLSLSFEGDSKTLVFSGNGTTARLDATSDVRRGLQKRSGVLTADGDDIPSPMAIIVDGVSYVPIVPVAKAFDCDYAWHGQYRLITVNMPSGAAEPGPPNGEAGTAAADRPAPDSAAVATGPLRTGSLQGFRTGVHDGFTRVAVDLGQVSEYHIAVRDEIMLVTFTANGAIEQYEDRNDDHLLTVYFTLSGGRPALVVNTRHPMNADGSGFRVGRTESNTLYIDFAPELRGPTVAQLVTDRIPGDTVLAQNAPAPRDPAVEPSAVAPVGPSEGRPVVVLDAGHGGKFPGARGHGNEKEEEIVLRVTLAAKALLEERGVEVVLTRDRDVHLANSHGADLAARAAFAAPERNLFVSIHANTAPNSGASGIETWVFGQPLDQRSIDRAIEENGGGNRDLGIALTNDSIQAANDTSGKILRETQLNYSRRLAHSVQQRLVRVTGANDRGVKQGPFHVIRYARTPAILVELGFLSNPEEGRKLADEAYQAELARALVDGILEFLETGGTLAAN